MTPLDFAYFENYQFSDFVKYEKKPCFDTHKQVIEGIHAVFITLNNPAQYNSYTTNMIREITLAFQKASADPQASAIVLTGTGNKAFCTGGNTKEYAEYYSGNPQAYKQYMRLFNDMVTTILMTEKPVICRVNGMRIGGGQEIGMACDFTISSDLANFGQAGPKHGSAPVGGATDFLPLFVGIENAMLSATLCEPWSAYKAKRLGLVTETVKVAKYHNNFIANPLVETEYYIKEGQIVFGDFKIGKEKETAKAILNECEIDLTLLDNAVNSMITSLVYTMPGCLIKTVEEFRKFKLMHWEKNKESNRSWLSLNMMTEAKAGFRAFNEGPKDNREINFIKLRQELGKNCAWDNDLIASIMPQAKR